MMNGLTRWIHKYDKLLFVLGFLVLFFTRLQWWRDIIREATYQGKHTVDVERGLRLGIILFILREVCLFFSFFWAFFHSSLSPSVEIGTVWPPTQIDKVRPFGVPLLNSAILLSRGASLTWAHMSILISLKTESHISLAMTVVLGVIFTALQIMEYSSSHFTLADSIYGGTFYIATGLHGLHVLIGTLFIVTIWIRQISGHFRVSHHFGFEASAWYWHFVDVVWLFLFICIYWWGA